MSALGSALALALTPGTASAQAPDWASQRFELTPDPPRATVGDPVTLHFRVHLHERDLLSDSVPRPIAALPEGVRILRVGPLRRTSARTYDGRASVAFYRTGRQPIPPFGLPYVRIVAGLRGVLVSDSAFVDIDPVAPAGNPSLKDIKEIERQRGPDPRIVAGLLGAAAVALVGALLTRRRRSGPSPAGAPAVSLPAMPGPYLVALRRLDEIERERWPARGEVDRHYEAVADVLRRYLAEAHGLPALERTTSELVWLLPPPLTAEDLRRRCVDLLGEADLVKFARRRPDQASAGTLLRAARDLLADWDHATATPAPATTYALR